MSTLFFIYFCMSRLEEDNKVISLLFCPNLSLHWALSMCCKIIFGVISFVFPATFSRNQTLECGGKNFSPFFADLSHYIVSNFKRKQYSTFRFSKCIIYLAFASNFYSKRMISGGKIVIYIFCRFYNLVRLVYT